MISKYLDEKLNHLHELVDASTVSISTTPVLDIESEIFKRLTSKKFRKWSLSSTTEDHIRAAIRTCVNLNEPLQLVYPFGGYKLWQLNCAPVVDWAEYFSIIYYVEYLIPIVSLYKPGIRLIFSSDDFILERMNNIPKRDTIAYLKSFSELIEFISNNLPKNISIELLKTSDLYSDIDLLEVELSSEFQKAQYYYESVSREKLQRDSITAETNIQWKGYLDLTNINKEDKNSYIMNSLIYHGAYTHLSKRLEYNRAKNKIIISATPSVMSIPIGTTKRSVVKFWIGTGIVENNDGKINTRVISLSQLEKLGFIKIDTGDTCLARSLTNSNFKHIHQV